MPSGKRDMRSALQNRVVLDERPHIADTPGERIMPGAKLVSVTRVRPNPNQPRKRFDPQPLEELSASIRERGVMQPLVVRPSEDGYSIIMGERRHRAAILAGLDEVPVIVRDTTDEQAYLDALIENLQRANLTVEEEAEAYQGLLGQGMSVRQIAEKLGVAHSKISRVTRIYEDPLLSEAVVEGRITKSQAQELLVVPGEEKPRLVQFIAGRRKRSEPVALDELRAEVERARQGGALRTNVDRPVESAPMHHAMEERDRHGHEELGPSPASVSGLDLETARARARALRRDVEGQLTSLAAATCDEQVAAELDAIRLAIERALGG